MTTYRRPSRVQPSGRRRTFRLLGAASAIALVVAACGSDDDTATTGAPLTTEAAAATAAPTDTDATADTAAAVDTAASDTAAPTDTAAAAPPEKAEISLGILPIADVAPVFIAIDQGFFADEGLTVSTEFTQGGAATIPALASGDLDIGFGAYPSFFNAVSQDLPLKIISEANRPAPLFAGLYSMPDSGIAAVADMAGKTIAVNTLNNVVQLAVEAQLVDAGMSLDDVTLVEIPFPDMVATLERGDVDVIAVVEPFGTIARTTLNATLVIDMFANRMEEFPVAGFFVTDSFLADNPNTVAAFVRAFDQAVEVANSDPDAVPTILPTYITTATEESARALNYPLFVSGIDLAVLQTVPDFMVEAGILTDPIDVAEYVAG
jgi:ABC-type nitrate/sulfonate/bicarbonate transport system substrate-binding protein